jgi:hypothetical protein
MTMEETDFEVAEMNGRLEYSDNGEIAVTVYPVGDSYELAAGEHAVTATAAGVDPFQFPHRVKCGTDNGPFSCYKCADPKCVPPIAPSPPQDPPLRAAGPQPTPMKFANTLSFSSTEIDSERGPAIVVLGMTETPTTDTVAFALFARVGTAAQDNIYHVYSVGPAASPPPEGLGLDSDHFTVLAIPIGVI